MDPLLDRKPRDCPEDVCPMPGGEDVGGKRPPAIQLRPRGFFGEASALPYDGQLGCLGIDDDFGRVFTESIYQVALSRHLRGIDDHSPCGQSPGRMEVSEFVISAVAQVNVVRNGRYWLGKRKDFGGQVKSRISVSRMALYETDTGRQERKANDPRSPAIPPEVAENGAYPAEKTRELSEIRAPGGEPPGRRPHSLATSGGVASLTNAASASSSPIDVCAGEPNRRTETARSAASRLPMARMTGVLCSECSRTL